MSWRDDAEQIKTDALVEQISREERSEKILNLAKAKVLESAAYLLSVIGTGLIILLSIYAVHCLRVGI